MASLLRMIEALLLVAMGAFMVVLARSDAYWHFMNPKYVWLTLGAGVLILVLAFAVPGNRARRPGITDLLGIAVFLGLALAAVVLPNPLYDFISSMPDTPGMANTLSVPGMSGADIDEAPQEPRLVIGGREYVKLNVAELLSGEESDQADKSKAAESGEVRKGVVHAGGRYAFQGFVLRSDALDKVGYIAVARVFLFCCAADAVGVTYLVRVDDPNTYADMQWIRVAGVMEPAEDMPKPPDVPSVMTALFSGEHCIVAEDIDTSVPEGIPYVFEIRSEEPFAY